MLFKPSPQSLSVLRCGCDSLWLKSFRLPLQSDLQFAGFGRPEAGHSSCHEVRQVIEACGLCNPLTSSRISGNETANDLLFIMPSSENSCIHLFLLWALARLYADPGRSQALKLDFLTSLIPLADQPLLAAAR